MIMIDQMFYWIGVTVTSILGLAVILFLGGFAFYRIRDWFWSFKYRDEIEYFFGKTHPNEVLRLAYKYGLPKDQKMAVKYRHRNIKRAK